MNLQETQEKMMELNKTMMETWKNVFGFKPEFLSGIGIDPIEQMRKTAESFSKMTQTDEKVLENQIRYQKAFIQYQTSLVEMTESIMEITKALNPIK